MRVGALLRMLLLVAWLAAWAAGCSTVVGSGVVSDVSRSLPTNIGLVRTALRVGFEDSLPELSLDTGRRVVLDSQEPGEDDWLIESEIGQVLRERGYGLLTNLPAADEAQEGERLTVLSYRSVDLRVVYRGAHRSGWRGERMIDRQAVARLDIRVLTWPEGEIVSLRETEGVASDTVPESELALLEGSEFPAENRMVEDHGQSGRLLEPLVVTGLVALLVYVFYTAESSD
ncbi:hypothetical protein AMJ71_07795 [candidate division TA06 bacterium SM1_40]|uniref:DUF4136 domain-containing protein n=1 Tax=candidate division TA06 bacterium SM1_40 TaxID=1703773 RepID=A0A0S8JH87_UNCT6|nr:MAG: hypothetical protein AMJ71_07795 [candidate division TA06 bacterium SM1_40]